MDFRVGSKVLMNPKSYYSGQDKGSDFGIVQRINSFKADYKYHVTWIDVIRNKYVHENDYRLEDLLPFVKEAQLEFNF